MTLCVANAVPRRLTPSTPLQHDFHLHQQIETVLSYPKDCLESSLVSQKMPNTSGEAGYAAASLTPARDVARRRTRRSPPPAPDSSNGKRAAPIQYHLKPAKPLSVRRNVSPPAQEGPRTPPKMRPRRLRTHPSQTAAGRRCNTYEKPYFVTYSVLGFVIGSTLARVVVRFERAIFRGTHFGHPFTVFGGE